MSNLALAEGYRRAVAVEFQKQNASTSPPSTTNTNTTTVAKTSTPPRPETATPSPAAAAPAAGKRPPFWKRRGRALTPRKNWGGRVRSAPEEKCGAGKEFFSAEALSVCISSVVTS